MDSDAVKYKLILKMNQQQHHSYYHNRLFVVYLVDLLIKQKNKLYDQEKKDFKYLQTITKRNEVLILANSTFKP